MGLLSERSLQCVSNAKHGVLVEVGSNDLPAHRQPAHATDGYRYRWDSGEIRGDCEDVVEIHLVGITDGANRKCWSRRSRSEDGIYAAGEDSPEIVGDEGADGLGFLVVRVVIAGGKHVGAEQNAPRHFGAETLGPRRFVHRLESFARVDA